MKVVDTPGKGWGYPTQRARKMHYFGHDGRSFCGSYAWFGPDGMLNQDDGKLSPLDCLACRRKLDKSLD